LVLYCLLQYSEKQTNLWIVFGSLSLAGLILSHNAITVMFLPIILFYALFLIWQTNRRATTILGFLMTGCMGIGVSAFFLFPAFFEGKYTLRDIVTSGGYVTSFVNPARFFSPAWSYGGTLQLSVQIGFLHWVGVLASIGVCYILYRKNSPMAIFLFVCIAVFFFCLFLMTKQSDSIWRTVSILQKFQFPWRFLAITVFLSALLSAVVVFVCPKKYQLLVIVLAVLLTLFLNRTYWHPQGFVQQSDHLFTGVYNGTTDTGESAPIWSVRFMEKRAKDHLMAINGKATIQEQKRTSTQHSYLVAVSNKTRFVENTLYFPGWRVLVDGNSVPIQFQDPRYRGIMTFMLEAGKHNVVVEFGETKLRLVSDALSLLSCFTLLGILIFRRNTLWRRSR